MPADIGSPRASQVLKEVMSFEIRLVDGLHKGLSTWARSPGALSLARNGGAESAIRAHLLHYLEEATSCVAFTEADRNRIDVTLRPQSAPNDEVVLLELKNNLLHRHQQRYIRESRNRAIGQLLQADEQIENVTGRYYLHFVIALCKDAQTKKNLRQLILAHNEFVPAYKRFLPADALKQELLDVQGIFQAPPARYSIAEAPESSAAPATLYCWLFSIPRTGNAEPVKRLSTLAPI
jgi:hypothetical protein